MSTYDASLCQLLVPLCQFMVPTTQILKLVEALPATSRHSKDSPWLLPSGPDQVDEISMREDQQSPHNNAAILTVAY
jgi:hypothetical protein